MTVVGDNPSPLDLLVYCGDLFQLPFNFNDGGLSALTVPVTLATGTIHVISTGNTPNSGTFNIVPQGATTQVITYTSKDANTFYGCTGGTGSYPAGTPVTWIPQPIDCSIYNFEAQVRPTVINNTTPIGSFSFDVTEANVGLVTMFMNPAGTTALNPVANAVAAVVLTWDLQRTNQSDANDIRTWYAGNVTASLDRSR